MPRMNAMVPPETPGTTSADPMAKPRARMLSSSFGVLGLLYGSLFSISLFVRGL